MRFGRLTPEARSLFPSSDHFVVAYIFLLFITLAMPPLFIYIAVVIFGVIKDVLIKFIRILFMP